MSLRGQSFISSEQLHAEDIQAIFSRARQFKTSLEKSGQLLRDASVGQSRVLAMVFTEPSTRTRLSFQIAAHRLGLRQVTLDNMTVSSVAKGETFEDTIRNVAAMGPDAMVVRYGVDPAVNELIGKLPMPVINGGIGTLEHPTQALLDAFTIQEFRGKVAGQKVLLVGDVLHSRVANSNLVLLKKMGAEVAYCAPKEFVPSDERWRGIQHFPDLSEAIRWANVVMGLRIQRERHQEGIGLSIAEYREKYRVGGHHLSELSKDAIIMHPGPVIRGVEFSDHVLSDPRCKVQAQVTNGVVVRASLLSYILGIEV